MIRSARGAIIIQVAFALIALLAFLTFVVDQGVAFVARRQAQNAADAGALAGALSLMANATDGAGAEAVARHYAHVNAVWGEATAQAHIIVPPPPIPCPDGIAACVRVDVFRGQPDRDGAAHLNTIPMFFGDLVGIHEQGVRATATAHVGRGNAVECIKPWIVVDRWTDNSPGTFVPNAFDQTDHFDVGVDTYTRPGYRADIDVGLQLMLKGDQNEYSSGWSMRIELGGGPGANVYREEIVSCPDYVKTIGIYDGDPPCVRRLTDVREEEGCVGVEPGVAQGPTDQLGVQELLEMDRSATWNTTTNTIDGGCTDAGDCRQHNPTGANISPRVIALALFDPQACATASCTTGNNTVAQVVNIMGFFLEGMCNDVYPDPATRPAWCGTNQEAAKMVVGRLMNYPGRIRGGTGSAGPENFLKVVQLIR